MVCYSALDCDVETVNTIVSSVEESTTCEDFVARRYSRSSERKELQSVN